MAKIVITGVSKGLGYSLAETFTDMGHDVYGCARSEKYPSGIKNFRQLDITDFSEVKEWAEEIGAVDYLINNAAIMNTPESLWNIDADEFSSLININVSGTFNTIKAFMPKMLDTGKGIVVNFSSGWGRMTSPNVAPYCASKYAVEGMSSAMAQEVPNTFAVVTLNPGVIETDMTHKCFFDMAESFQSPSEWVRKAADFILNITPKDNGSQLSID
jgi:NAD(P)-dependent dehydrogenase (short-subunit alcohol dehydrogenase family)